MILTDVLNESLDYPVVILKACGCKNIIQDRNNIKKSLSLSLFTGDLGMCQSHSMEYHENTLSQKKQTAKDLIMKWQNEAQKRNT